MSTASVTPGNSRTGVVDPPNQEQQQPQITAVTNGGVSIVPNSISDGPLVHMGMHFSLFSFGLPIQLSVQDARRPPYRGRILDLWENGPSHPTSSVSAPNA